MTLLVMAAGMGSRYGGMKQIEPVGTNGELIIDYSVYDAIQAHFNKCVFVIRKDIEEEFNERFYNRICKVAESKIAFQEIPTWRKKPYGTAHAVLAAKDVVHEPFCVIAADDFYGRDAFKRVEQFLDSKDAEKFDGAVIGYKLVDTLSEYGTVNRGVVYADKNANVTSFAEVKCLKRDGKIGYLDGANFVELPMTQNASMALYCLKPSVMPLLEEKFEKFLSVHIKDENKEFIMTEILSDLIRENRIKLKLVPTTAKWVGFTYKEDKPLVEQEIRGLIESGIYPAPLWKNK